MMRKLSDHDIHILSVVAKHERICIGVPVSAEWTPIAKTLALLARPNPGVLVEEQTDDGPAYSLSAAGRAKLAE
jgi:hypothetical protein